MNSCEKGKRGEREFAKYLRKHGFEARRGQQHAGGADSPDVICPRLPGIHFEVKRVERPRTIYDWLDQAVADADGGMPVIAHRQNDRQWVAILPMEQLLWLLQGQEP